MSGVLYGVGLILWSLSLFRDGLIHLNIRDIKGYIFTYFLNDDKQNYKIYWLKKFSLEITYQNPTKLWVSV